MSMIHSTERITKALIRLHGWAGWSAPWLFTYPKDRFSHIVVHFIIESINPLYSDEFAHTNKFNKDGNVHYSFKGVIGHISNLLCTPDSEDCIYHSEQYKPDKVLRLQHFILIGLSLLIVRFCYCSMFCCALLCSILVLQSRRWGRESRLVRSVCLPGVL